MNIIWLLLFFISIMIAWYVGRYSRPTNKDTQHTNLSRDYFVGLNFLLNEEPDKAVDIFIKMLEVDSNTVETHLALGKLFRRRGEVDRAIRIHQNLIARPQLEKIYREQSLFELGQDYLSAGVLDRAERIFMELSGVKTIAPAALRALLDIYQQEKDWENAIETAKKLESVAKSCMQSTIAHYYCELTDMALIKRNHDLANHYIKKALMADNQCVRASLLQGRLLMTNHDYKAALRSLKRIKNQNPAYLSEAIDLVATCYEAINEEEKLVSYLTQILEDHPRTPVVLILSERIRKWKGDKVAANFVADYVRRYPSVSGLHLFINLYLSYAEGRARDDLLVLQGLTKKLLADKPGYQCTSCGFSGKSLHWQCPGCKQWSAMKPWHSLQIEPG